MENYFEKYSKLIFWLSIALILSGVFGLASGIYWHWYQNKAQTEWTPVEAQIKFSMFEISRSGRDTFGPLDRFSSHFYVPNLIYEYSFEGSNFSRRIREFNSDYIDDHVLLISIPNSVSDKVIRKEESEPYIGIFSEDYGIVAGSLSGYQKDWFQKAVTEFCLGCTLEILVNPAFPQESMLTQDSQPDNLFRGPFSWFVAMISGLLGFWLHQKVKTYVQADVPKKDSEQKN